MQICFCPGGAVSWERAIERRNEIFNVYEKLNSCDIIIITLGLVESWFDKSTEYYLNRMPPVPVAKKDPGRFVLSVMDVCDAMPLLEKAITRLGEKGKKVIITVSPVPLQTTLTNNDAVVANAFSKSVLRVCADRLMRKFSHVDYFPSYEIVRSFGLAGFIADNVHVRPDLVRSVTTYMVDRYSIL